MKVMHVYVHNVLGVKDIEFNMEGHHLFLIGGGNGNGKTSSVRAVQMALSGRSGTDWPEIPLREGEDEGEVVVKLSGDDDLHETDHLRAVLKLTRRPNGTIKETLDVFDSTGAPAGSPIKLLQDLYKLRSFDPTEFMELKPEQQREKLCKMLGIDVDSIRADRKKVYDERTAVNRDHKKAKAEADAMPHHKDAPKDLVDVVEVSAKLEAATEKNHERSRLCDSLETAAKNVVDQQAEVDRLRKELANAEAELAARRGVQKLADTALRAHGDEIDVSVLRDEIKQSSAVNEKVLANRARMAKYKEVRDLVEKSEKLTRQIAAFDKQEKDILQAAKWPLPGMSVSDTGVTINGIPLEQSSEAEGLLLSAMIGIEMRPKLRLMVLRRGSAFDTRTLQSLESLAKSRDFQLMVEVVTRSDGDEALCHVVLEDGEEKRRERPAIGPPEDPAEGREVTE